jgi:N-dimethylarginine dimethylaminohydrolase
MNPGSWQSAGSALHEEAEQQWFGLHDTLLALGAAIDFVEPEPNLPDLVFTANAAIVLDGKALLARFRHRERQIEEPVFAAAFHALAERGLIEKVVELPAGIALEGAGDCLWDRTRKLFWMGCGFRSDAAAAHSVQSVFGVPCVALELANPSYYHLDTAMCALPCGAVVYYPGAFSPAALDAIHARVLRDDRIALNAANAAQFAANAICAGRTIVLSSCSADLRRSLEARGYRLVETPLTAFQRSGGSACCLALRLDHVGQAQVAAPRLAAAG